MWPFKKKESVPEESLLLKEIRERQEKQERESKEATEFFEKHFPVGTEFILLGVRFRVYRHNISTRYDVHSVKANYITSQGTVDSETFQLEELRTYVEGPNPLEIHNGRNE